MKLKHVKLFESFQDSEMGKVYATCFQGDSYVGVGILTKEENKKLQDALNKLHSDPYFKDLDVDLERIELVDVTGMGYILHDSQGAFIAMPKSTNTDDYEYYINKDGNMPLDSDMTGNVEDRLFDLVEGSLLAYDHDTRTERVSVDKFIKVWMGV